jgi:hypothetical protein
MEVEVFFLFFLVLVLISFKKSVVVNMTDTLLGKLFFIILIIYFSSKSPLLGLFMTLVVVIYSGLLMENGVFTEGFAMIITSKKNNKKLKNKNKTSKERMTVENSLRIGKSSKNIHASKTQNNDKDVSPSYENVKHPGANFK